MPAYVPEPGHWQSRAPAAAGFDPDAFAKALSFAPTREVNAPIDLKGLMPNGERHPNDRPLGPTQKRSAAAGLVVKDGYLIGSFGPVQSVETTFSVTKSYISAVAGLAYDRGLLPDLDEPVGVRVRDGGFDAPHNGQITWRQLLQQTSEWEGELFGLPDWIDRGRQVGSSAAMSTAEATPVIGGSAAQLGDYRSLQAPGTFWEYNDVRVNRAALSLLRLFGTPLPQILKEHLMDPIGASSGWTWHGYETSWVEHNGTKMQSVSGGAHWGGGLWIDSYDHARFGLLYQRRGLWGDRRLLSEEWIDHSLTPCPIQPEYGLLWWLNHDHAMSDLAGPEAFAARGAGGNVIFVEPQRDLVIVLRWCGDIKGVVDRILEAMG